MGILATATIDPELLAQAEEFGLDVNSLLANEIQRRREALRKAQDFYEENRESIDSYNAYIDKYGPAGKNRSLRRS